MKGNDPRRQGHLGAFEITVDDYAQPLPSSRGDARLRRRRANGAISRCDIIIDLSGGAPLFPAADLRDGYLRADPGDPAALLRAVLQARDLVGTFDKPRYITFTDDLCAHSRSKIVGCPRCLDLCPTGAIAPAGDHVAIDPQICAGCGQCAAACPTGAAAYALPPADALLRKLRTLLTTYREAGGARPVVLLHDGEHGARADRRAGAPRRRPAGERAAASRSTRSRRSASKPIAAAFAYGASAVRFLLRAQAAARRRRPCEDARAGRADPRRPRLRRGPRGDDRDRRSRCARRGACAPIAAGAGRRDPRASCRSAPSAT